MDQADSIRPAGSPGAPHRPAVTASGEPRLTIQAPFTEKMLIDWAGPKKFQEGRALHERDTFVDVTYDPPIVSGTIVAGSRMLKTSFRLLPDGTAESLCPCYDNRERGIICSHVVALGIEFRRRLNRPEVMERRRAEERRAARVAAMGEGGYLRRARPGDPGAIPARLELALPAGWTDALRAGRMPLECRVRYNGHCVPVDAAAAAGALALPERDEALLFVLEDIAAGPPTGRMEVGRGDFINVLELMAGRAFATGNGHAPVAVDSTRVPFRLRIRLDAETGELLLSPAADLPAGPDGARPLFLAHRRAAWVFDGAAWRPLDRVLPEPMHRVYEHEVSIPRAAVPRFLRSEMPSLAQFVTIDSDVTPDLFTIEPAEPLFRLHVRGSPASLSAVLNAEYDGFRLVAGKSDPAGHFALPDAVDLLRYTVRNTDREEAALRRLATLGFGGPQGDQLSPLIGERRVMNFLARHLPSLRRIGWKVGLQGRAETFLDEAPFATPVVRVTPQPGGRWFEVEFSFEDARGVSLTSAEIQRAIRMGDSHVERDGRIILFDAGAVEALNHVFEDCASADGSRPGSFRLSNIYAAYVKESLNALDGVDIEADVSWQQAVDRQTQRRPDAPVTIPEPLRGRLRPYQHDGAQWLRYLEQCGFAGILADEMGLGKTVQTLAWLQMDRLNPEARGRPSLVVCPTSLVENWAEEASRFTPGLRVSVVSGLDRHARWEELGDADLLVTSYALMRRDVDRYLEREFAVIVMDEAQHIKNRATQNAIAAKRLKAYHRLVLTGTPMENSVADLWSIMDFLMPGYLGTHESFRHRYEQTIAAGGDGGDEAQRRLRRKLQPFLLRRLKRDVARELPPKVQRVAWCTLTGDQQKVYRELLENSRRRIADMVRERGFDASRMEILRTLLRLRQACCHLGLLRLDGLQSAFPSAKMDLLFELLDEAIDGGHRVLVFSQFVSMLTLLRREMDRREWRYCYLDGATQDRLDVVKRFNSDRRIPFFLISLKAGGTGLNLTGADMVVHYDPWWNPAVEDQATDRAYRIGQKRMVYSVKLIARDTVEEKVLAMQKRKQAIIDATVRADGEPLHRMNWDDVRELLEL